MPTSLKGVGSGAAWLLYDFAWVFGGVGLGESADRNLTAGRL